MTKFRVKAEDLEKAFLLNPNFEALAAHVNRLIEEHEKGMTPVFRRKHEKFVWSELSGWGETHQALLYGVEEIKND